MKTAKKLVGLLVLGTFLSACATTLTGRRQLAFLPDDTMNAMGIQAFAQMKEQVPVQADRAINSYVRCVAGLVASQASIKGMQWEVVVFDDDSANAFALPGGKIGVHTGILKVATTPDQLAAIIGHEVSHVLLRHGNERASQTLLTQGLLSVADIGTSKMDPRARNAIVGGLGMGAQMGVLLPFSRKHESESDYWGQRLMAKAGFNPNASVVLWQNMARLGGERPPEFMSTHPASETRIAALTDSLEETMPIFEVARAEGYNPTCKAPATPATR